MTSHRPNPNLPFDALNPHANLSEAERGVIEAQSYNFARTYGRPMALPPMLYETLRLGGVDMRHIVADPSLEN